MTNVLALTLVLQEAARAAPEQSLTTFSISFMLISMGIVTLVTIWSFARILRTKRHFDPDGTGPARPPVPGEEDRTP